MNASNFKDISGERFGRLTAVEHVGTNSSGGALWLCRCDCGSETIVAGKSLRSGNTKSCGCLNRDASTERIVKLNTTHGKSSTRLFKRWCSMLTRCYNQKATNYKDYGGRGIKVCDEWHNFPTFEEWALSNGYAPNKSIDRIDLNKGYEPGNCRFTTAAMQAENRRTTRMLEFDGETHSLAAWARKYGKDPTNLQGLSKEAAIKKLTAWREQL